MSVVVIASIQDQIKVVVIDAIRCAESIKSVVQQRKNIRSLWLEGSRFALIVPCCASAAGHRPRRRAPLRPRSSRRAPRPTIRVGGGRIPLSKRCPQPPRWRGEVVAPQYTRDQLVAGHEMLATQ